MALTARRGPVDTAVHVAMQGSLFASGDVHCKPITARPHSLDDRSWVLFQPSWLAGSDGLFEQLRTEMAWQSMERPMYDRIVDVPRLICTVKADSLGESHPLLYVTKALESALNSKFFSIGLNYYRDGNDSVAWHADSIDRTARPATVALVSLGSPRTLAMRRRAPDRSKTAETTRSSSATAAPGNHRWRLGHGDLFIMSGACQRDWEHGVPKERAVGPRISLAFRSRERAEGPRKGRAGVPPLLASRKLR